MTEPAEPLGANILDLVLTRENQILTAVRGVRTEVDEIEAVDVETHPSLYDLVKGIAASLTTNQLATAAALKEIAAQVATIYKATVKPSKYSRPCTPG